LDFIEGLPVSSSFNCVLVVVDKFSKYSHFIKLKHPFIALKVAQLFMDNIYKPHGMPQAIISDRDKIITSLLWKELFRLSGTELRMSSAYHRRVMTKLNGLTKVLKLVFAVLYKPVLPSGCNGLPLQNFGTIPIITLPSKSSLLRFCMVKNQNILAAMTWKHVPVQIWNLAQGAQRYL
jgi:hypothetical protein